MDINSVYEMWKTSANEDKDLTEELERIKENERIYILYAVQLRDLQTF